MVSMEGMLLVFPGAEGNLQLGEVLREFNDELYLCVLKADIPIYRVVSLAEMQSYFMFKNSGDRMAFIRSYELSQGVRNANGKG